MNKLILSVAMVATSFLSAQDNKLEVEVTGFKNNKGFAKVGLYNTKDSFLRQAIKSVKTEIKGNKTYAIFNNVPKGEYAVSMYHDENANNTMDANFIGIPKEGYATSNNAKGFMGPPKYEDAKFTIATDKKISIRIN